MLEFSPRGLLLGHAASGSAGFRPVLTGSAAAARGLQSAGSVAEARRLSCPVECEIIPDRGLKPCRCVDRQILNHWAIREAR